VSHPVASPCPECGTPADQLTPAPLPRTDWRRWLWPTLAILWLAGMILTSNCDWWGPPHGPPPPNVDMPIASLTAHLKSRGRDALTIADLRHIEAHGGDGTLTRSALPIDGYFYSDFIHHQGHLAAVTTTTPTGAIGSGIAFGWPWAWFNKSVMVQYANVADRTPIPSIPDTYPPNRHLRLLSAMWTSYPNGGWLSHAFDLTPLIAIAFLVWLAGRVASLFMRPFRTADITRRRVMRAARLGVLAAALIASIASRKSAESASPTIPPFATSPAATPLSPTDLERLLTTPDADREVARALLAALPPDTPPDTYVLACTTLPARWWIDYTRPPPAVLQVDLPFLSVYRIQAAAPESLPGPTLRHWSWMLWLVFAHDAATNTALAAQVTLDQTVLWLSPFWLLLTVPHRLIAFIRTRRARRRVAAHRCITCGYPCHDHAS